MSIPLEFFEKHFDKIEWDGLCQNSSIPVEFFEKHIDKIEWDGLCQNSFNIV
jgi:hypothetical protein